MSVALLFLLVAGAAQPSRARALDLRVDGRILRESSGKLVTSLTAFELGDRRDLTLESRKTGERMTLGLFSVYEDLSYTEALPPQTRGRLDDDEWIPFVVWNVPDDLPSLNARLREVHAHQNVLRRGLGSAIAAGEEEAAGKGRLTSRLALNKIEKFHRVAAALAGEIRRRGAEGAGPNPFLFPVRIEVGFDPFARSSSAAGRSPLAEIREVLYWEAHRTVTQQFGVDESFVDFIFDSPSTVREFAPPEGADGLRDFAPSVTIAAESIDAALYVFRQGFGRELKHLVRLGAFRDPFIKDRPHLDAFVNEGKVAGVRGRRIALTFVPPFMKAGETVAVAAGAEGREEIPVVLEDPRPAEGVTLSRELPGEVVARLRPGMPARRK